MPNTIRPIVNWRAWATLCKSGSTSPKPTVVSVITVMYRQSLRAQRPWPR